MLIIECHLLLSSLECMLVYVAVLIRLLHPCVVASEQGVAASETFGVHWTEAPALFKRQNYYYALSAGALLAPPTRCACILHRDLAIISHDSATHAHVCVRFRLHLLRVGRRGRIRQYRKISTRAMDDWGSLVGSRLCQLDNVWC